MLTRIGFVLGLVLAGCAPEPAPAAPLTETAKTADEVDLTREKECIPAGVQHPNGEVETICAPKPKCILYREKCYPRKGPATPQR